ncbi:MAG: hypothetical protein JNG90_11160 [Planctomycetaceae bacterium]|nr:hypothetical protein [Planctomycetaceae bacterium]
MGAKSSTRVFGRLLLLAALLPSLAAAQGVEDLSDEALARAGIRRLESERLTLYTDLPSIPAVDQLPALFDQAYPQWCQYFRVPEEQVPPWHATACLMRAPERFKATGLLPPEVPAFQHGYTLGDHFWLNEQPSDYYRRHLLLHEGAHAFMFTRLGTCGPTWYMEGIAELLATHRLADDRLELKYFPRDRDEVPYWGRIKLIEDANAAGEDLRLERLLPTSPRELTDRLGYAWAWGAAAFLDGHPRARDRFRQAAKLVRAPDFNRRLESLLDDDWAQLSAEFGLFLHDIEYGYDFARTQLDWQPGKRLPAAGKKVTIQADRGWQNTGVALEKGKTYELRAAGRYVVHQDPQVWWCEPGGVTLRYYRGRPLGELLAVVVPAAKAAAKSPPWGDAIPVGLGGALTPAQAGTLFLKVNDSPAELAENQGELQVEIKSASAAAPTSAGARAN